MNLQASFSAVIICLLAGCPRDDGRPELTIHAEEGDQLSVIVRNDTARTLTLPKRLVVAGRTGGDTVALIVRDDGRLFPTCAFADVFDQHRDTIELKPGEAHEGWRGSLKLLKQWHCLEPGRYSVAFGLVLPGTEMAISAPVRMNVSNDGSATFANVGGEVNEGGGIGR